jgi:hypothetical protein
MEALVTIIAVPSILLTFKRCKSYGILLSEEFQ